MIASLMGLVPYAACLAVGGGLGAAFYRYMLKRDPAKLELWAAQVKAAAEKAKA